jgi:hypothetical protein
MTRTQIANRTANAMMTSIAFSPSIFAGARILAWSVRLPRRCNYAVGGGALPSQLGLQFFRLPFQSHPAELANPFNKIIRSALGCFRLVALWLLERHWHNILPNSRCFSFLFFSDCRRPCGVAVDIGRNYDSPKCKSVGIAPASPRCSFYLPAPLRKGAGVRRTILRQKIGVNRPRVRAWPLAARRCGARLRFAQ